MYYLVDDDPDLMYGEEDFEKMVGDTTTEDHVLNDQNKQNDQLSLF